MIVRTNYKVNKDIINDLDTESLDINFKFSLNRPLLNFFYDSWVIKDEFKGTVWDRILQCLPIEIGEARLIKLPPGHAYRSHADIDDRYHFNISGERSFIIYTELNQMYPQFKSKYWYEMNAGHLHSAVNTGRIDRIQLVVRKLLNKNTLLNPISVCMKPLKNKFDYRYVFDEVYSPWLNLANKRGIINNFYYDDEIVSFNLENAFLKDFEDIKSSHFKINFG